EVVDAGWRLARAQVGARAAAGLGSVACTRRARVAVLTTGTELRRPGTTLGPGEVYEANGAMLAARLAVAGAEVERLDPVSDDEQMHRLALARGLPLDGLVTSGGGSVGPHRLGRPGAAQPGRAWGLTAM